MERKPRIITVKEGDEEIYHGPDKRFYDGDYKPSFLGIAFGDWLKIGLAVFGIATFMIKDNIRITSLEEGQKSLTEISKSMQSYMEAADGWHSSTIGTQFKGGRPIDGGYRKNRNGGDL